MDKCLFCDNEASVRELPDLSYSTFYDCNYCGKYIFDSLDSEAVNDSEVKFKMACVLNERRLKGLTGIAIDEKTDLDNKVLGFPRIALQDILNEFPKKAGEYFNRAILNLSRFSTSPFEIVEINPKLYCKSFFCKDLHQAVAFLKELDSQNLITYSGTMEVFEISFTTKFWVLVENIKQTEVDSKQAFVAMWFDSSMNEYYSKGIEPAIRDAGYDPVRIDTKEFNNKICDEIIAEINRSKFIISDFSGQRGGVYFEAGYGMGQGKPVIFTVREEDVKDLHFDTRQYNHIVYTSPEDLYKKLYNRICATIV